MPIDTNLNRTPFFDDFDESKNYHRVLFRPAVPVQARELTQLQTILQNQIERFGDHVFIQGSIIKGCSFTFDREYSFAKILDVNADGIDVNMSAYNNTYVVDEQTGLKALVVETVTGLQSDEQGDYNTLYFKYLNVGSASEKRFANNKTLTIFNRNYSIQSVVVEEGGSGYSNGDLVSFTSVGGVGSSASGYVITVGDGSGAVKQVVVTDAGSGYTTAPTANIVYQSDGTTPTNGLGALLTPRNYIDRVFTPTTEQAAPTGAPVGTGYALKISDGIIYQKGNFIRVDEQSTIVSKYDLNPNNVVVGFRTIETIANNSIDPTLNDNAAGFTNANAPGAFRLKLTPQLVTLTKEQAAANSEFFTLVEFENGQPVRQNQKAAYSEISNELARRTFEESGNYVVRKFSINTEDHPNDSTKLNAVVGGGLGYIDGHRVELFNAIRVPFNKATTTATVSTASISTNFGSYVFVKEYKGEFDLTAPLQVDLRDTAVTGITSNIGGMPTPTGSVVGSAYVRGIEHFSGTPGTAGAVYKLYLFNIKMNAGKVFDQVRSIVVNSTAVADVVTEVSASTGSDIAVLKETAFSAGVFPSGMSAVKTYVDEDYFVRTDINNETIEANGFCSATLTSPYTLPYTGVLNDEQKDQLIIIPTTTSHASWASRSGTISGNSTSAIVTGATTAFLTEYAVGDYIAIANSTGGYSHSRQILRIANNTSLELTANAISTGSFSGVDHTRSFPSYAPIPVNARATALGNVSISAANSTTLHISLGESLQSSLTATIVTNARTSSSRRTKTITKNAYVKIAAADANSSATSWSLGLPDVLRVVGVYRSTNNSVYDEATDITSNFVLDNGQRDAHYGLARLNKAAGSVLALDGTKNLVVKLDVFSHTSGGYFNVDSYPLIDSSNSAAVVSNTTISWADIPVYTCANGVKVALRDSIDTRVVASNTVAITTTIGLASIANQAAVETFASVVHPAPNQLYTADVTRFLPRRDLVVVDNRGRVTVVEGIPASNPAEPIAPTGSLVLASMVTPPYPTLPATTPYKLPEYTTSSTAKQNQRYTMKDIERLDKKIEQLQYYSLLSTLEQDTKSRVIPSETNSAMERFKNGFFADPLMTYDFVDLANEERRIAIDTKQAVATPLFEQSKIDLKVSATNNVVRRGDIALIDYNSRTLISQPIATNIRNPSQAQWKYSGALYLSPNYDNYVSTTVNPVVLDLATPMAAMVNGIVAGVNDVFEQYHLNESSKSTNVTWQTGWGSNWASSATYTSTTTAWDYLQLSMSSNTQTTNVGSFVTDLSMNPYMKGQPIVIVAYGLRPGTRHYVYFDEKPVSNLVAPARLPANWTYSRAATVDDVVLTGLRGAALTSDNSGILVGVFYMPDNTFFVGERDMLIVDVDQFNSIETSTSRCSSKYNAYNLDVNKGNLTMTTASVGGSFIQTNHASVTVNSAISTYTVTWGDIDPLAQTFLLSNEIARDQDGLYLTEVDLYFKERDEVFGLIIEVRTVELGTPTRTRIGSKRLSPAQVNLSNNASVATTVTFDTPVYLRANQEYAIVVVPEAYTPNYRIWTGKAGEYDVANPTVQKVQDWNQGAMFVSTNGSTWSSFQNEDLKINVKFAEFKSTAGTLTLANEDKEFITISASTGSLEVGEPVGMFGNTYVEKYFATTSTSNSVITASGDVSTELLANDSIVMVHAQATAQKAFTAKTKNGNNVIVINTAHSNTIAVNDYVIIGNSGLRKITSLSNTTAFVVDKAMTSTLTGQTVSTITTANYDVARVVSVSGSAVTLNKYPKFVANNTNRVYAIRAVSGEVDFISANASVVHLRKSNAANSTFRFATGSQFVGGLSNTIVTIASIDNPGISYFDTLVTTVAPSGTSITATANVMNTSGSKINSAINMNDRNELAFEGMIRSRSNEVNTVGQPKSFDLTYALSTESTWNSPAVNLSPASILRYKYKVNNTQEALVGETTRQGNAQTKYVSKPVVLADGQEGEDLKVYISAYRPANTDVFVYARVVNETDGTNFYDRDWTLLTLVSSNTYSSSSNKTDYKEFEFTFPTTPPAANVGSLVVTNSNTTINTPVDFTNASLVTTTVAVGDLVVLQNPANQTSEIRTVASVNTTVITVTSGVSFSNTGVSIKKVTQPGAAFKNYENGAGGIVRYFNGSLGAYDGYKKFAVKVVMVSDNYAIVPRLDDVRAIACSV